MTHSIPSPRHPRRQLLLAGLATAALIVATTAAAEPATSIKIHAGSLESALLALSAQTHQQVMYSRDLVAGRTAPALAGTYTAEQAVRLLAPADTVITRAGPSVLVLRKAPATSNATPRPEVAAGRPFGGDAAPASGEAAPLAQRTTSPSLTATTVEEVQVTGTLIHGAQSASPLVVVSRADIDRSGRATVAEALNALPQNFAGIETEGSITTGADRLFRNTAYATGINLRGLGSDATLVLVNGRRMAGAGLFGDFSDISAIPTAAVDHVEILLDGASALYGSDAVGGVVNVILRRDFDGAETRLLAGTGTASGPSQTQVSQTFGHRWTGGNVVLSYEYQQRGELASADRSFASNADLRPLGGHDQRLTTAFPGNILKSDPVTGAQSPGFAIPAGQNGVGLLPSQLQPGVINLENQRQGTDILPSQSLQAVYLAANQDLGDRVELSADARYSFRRFAVNIAPNTANIFVNKANPFFVAPTGAATETVTYSFLGQLPNPRTTGSAESLGVSLGGTVRLGGDWRSDGYLAFAQETEDTHVAGVLNSTALTEAVGSVADRPDTTFSTAQSGFFNPFTGFPGANSPTVLAYIGSGFTRAQTRTTVSSANLEADGSLISLPAGPVKLAFGAQARRETLNGAGVNFTSTTTPTAQTPTDVSRSLVAGFAELRVPLFGPANALPGIQRLEVSVAGRVERYSDVGSTANPQTGVLWEPLTGLSVRGTYGRSFRAPTLSELHAVETDSPGLFPFGAGRLLGLLRSGGNPNLRPETADSWTLGADFAPTQWPGLRLGATWFDVRFKNRIGLPVQAKPLGALTDPSLSSFVNFISPATNAADLAKITALLALPGAGSAQSFGPSSFGAIVENRYINTTTLEVRGFDVTGSYRFDVGADNVALAGNASYLANYDQQITPKSPVLNKAGIANFPVKFRGRMTADWTHDRITAGAAFNYVGAYHGALGQSIRAQPTVDLQVRLAGAAAGVWRGTGLTLNVRNVFDKAPPFYDNPFGVAYDAANADPIGRFVSVQLTKTW